MVTEKERKKICTVIAERREESEWANEKLGSVNKCECQRKAKAKVHKGEPTSWLPPKTRISIYGPRDEPQSIFLLFRQPRVQVD